MPDFRWAGCNFYFIVPKDSLQGTKSPVGKSLVGNLFVKRRFCCLDIYKSKSVEVISVF